jgi:hypothetical protein
LVDVALDFHYAVRGLVLLRIATTRGQLYLTDTDRAAIGVEALQRFFLGTTTNRVASLLDRRFHLRQTSAEPPHRHLNGHLLSRSPEHLRYGCTLFFIYKMLQHTSTVNSM